MCEMNVGYSMLVYSIVIAYYIQMTIWQTSHFFKAWRNQGLPLTTTSNEAAKMYDATITQVCFINMALLKKFKLRSVRNGDGCIKQQQYYYTTKQ